MYWLWKAHGPTDFQCVYIYPCAYGGAATHCQPFAGIWHLWAGHWGHYAVLWRFRDREKILHLFEWVSGARSLDNYLWIGGVAHDLPAGYLDKMREFVEYFTPRIEELNDLLSLNKFFIERTANIGIHAAEVASAMGWWARSAWQWRALGSAQRELYCVYDRLDFDVPVGTGEFGPMGPPWIRYMVRVREILES